ncbi:hypothetical protein [Cryptosporangium sp. NPDC051539]|uniref:arsenate reductase/protein-tyrosine-phosphatase family protein n=1 Tax=Cryptosporangium sp. NPDC051539 TaxID=3363962 RepID=UPI003790047F
MGGILFVCTANQIRSPFAERLMRAALYARFGRAADAIPVTSAGTHAMPGRPIWPEAAAELARRGVDAAGHSSRPLTPLMVRRSSLVLTADRGHRAHVLTLVRDAHVFTLRELAWRLADAGPADVPGEHLADRLDALPYLVRAGSPDLPPDLDIADPVGGPEAGFVRAAAEIEQALAVGLRVL